MVFHVETPLKFLRLRRLRSDDSDFFHKSESMCKFFEKRGYPVSVVQADHHRAQLIDRQSSLQTSQKEHSDRIPFTLTFHPHNHSVKSIILKTLNYSKMIQRLVLSFRNLHSFHSNATKTQAIFWSEVHSKLMTNPALLNELAHDSKLVLSFTTPTKYQDLSDPLRSLITSRAPPPTSSIS